MPQEACGRGDQRFMVRRGREVVWLNWLLAERQGVSEEGLADLRESHLERLRLFEEMRGAESLDRLRELANEFDALEYHQQALWGFEANPLYHQWHDVPRCLCSKVRNRFLVGLPVRIVSGQCPLHGDGWMPGRVLAVLTIVNEKGERLDP